MLQGSIHCTGCRNRLGEIVDGQYVMSHRGRRLVGPIPQLIVCEQCGESNFPATRVPTPTTAEMAATA